MAAKYTNARTEKDYDDVRRLHAAGLGRNDICRETGRSAHLVSAIAAELGLVFPRGPEVEAAMETRRAQLAERRMLTAEILQAKVEQLLDKMDGPTTVYAFGGKDNTFASETLPEPPADVRKALMSTIGMALDRSLKLEPIRDDGGAEAARTMVGQLMTGLAEVYRQQQEADPAGGEGAGDAP
ncbi:helix-turn-helix domain-containing protein [Kitasatospora cineracea]